MFFIFMRLNLLSNIVYCKSKHIFFHGFISGKWLKMINILNLTISKNAIYEIVI